MAVTVLPRTRARAPLVAETLPAAVLGPPLLAPGLDLLRMVQPVVGVPGLGASAAALGALVLVLAWLRYPRTGWLGAAALAAMAGLVMRLLGADVAPLLSLLAVVALGVGGAFASPRRASESWLA
jgi:hypothetical protein